MVIQSALDEYPGISESSSSEADEGKSVKKKNSTLKWVIIALAVLLSINIATNRNKHIQQAPVGGETTIVQLLRFAK